MRFCPLCRSIYTAHVEFCGIDGSGLVQTDSDPLVGYEVDRYLVLERIGMGAMGSVYRVQHTVLEQEHAMKILYGDLGQDERIVERFKREAKAISKMRHPNILSVTDFGRTTNGLTFLVMEYVHGTTLMDLIIGQAPLSISRTARIAEQIAAGLGEAHRLGFVHRDVKPANIVVGDHSGYEYLKILDFGIVGLRTEAFDTRLTGTGFIIGTPAYMAPEQARDPSFVTPAADFYSLGIIIYEMLTGNVPFEATQPVDMIIQHSIDPVPPLPPSGGLEMIVDWCLEKSPDRRPQSAEELLAELARLNLGPEDEIETRPGIERPNETMEMMVADIGVPHRDLLALVDAELRSPHYDLPMLDPITYQGTEQVIVHYEGLRSRLDRIYETLSGAAPEIEHGIRRTFETRLAEMKAAVRPGLREYRYLDLATKIAELERELWSRVGLRPA